MTLSRIHLKASGLVQGVGYRMVARKKAEVFGLVGWVKNTPDGAVETVAEGSLQALEAYRLWCLEGPTNAVVSSVDVISLESIAAQTFTGFEIRHSS